MAPKKKKAQPHNSFYFFMVERQRQMERAGRHFPGGLRDVANAVSAEWDSMGPQARQPFESMAQRDKGRHGERYTTQGETYEEVDRREEEKKARINLMKETIKNFLIVQGRNTGLKTASFFFIHVNYHCQKETAFYPAEMALARYTIQCGIDQDSVFHEFIDLEPLPLGLAHKAQLMSNDSHMIPQPPLPERLKAETDANMLFRKIESYVMDCQEDEQNPPFYTLEKFVPSVESILAELSRKNGHDELDHFRVYPLEQLFFDIKNFSLKPAEERLTFNGVTDNGFPYKSFSDNILQDDKYGYQQRIACDFHEEADRVQHCSRSYVIRWGWHFSNNLCANMDVEMLLHRHCPGDTDLSNAVPIRPRPVVQAQTYQADYIDDYDDDHWTQVSRSSHVTAGVGRGRGIPGGHEPAPPVSVNAWSSKNGQPKGPRDDLTPLRKPNTQSKAMTLEGAVGGAVFNAGDFPAIGGMGLGRGRVARPPPGQAVRPPPGQAAWSLPVYTPSYPVNIRMANLSLEDEDDDDDDDEY